MNEYDFVDAEQGFVDVPLKENVISTFLCVNYQLKLPYVVLGQRGVHCSAVFFSYDVLSLSVQGTN